MDIFFSFSSPENVEKVWGLLQRKIGLNPNVFHWPYKGGYSTFLEKSFKWLKIENKNNRKIRKTQKNNYFLMSVASLYTPCFVMFCVFLYGTFCHGAHKLDLSTLLTTFFLWTSLPFILIWIFEEKLWILYMWMATD